MPVAVTGSQGVFPIVCRVDNSADATNSFTSLTVDFETMTAHWAESGSCVYSKAGTRQTHLAAVERAGGNFAQADFHYNYPMIGSILEQNGQFYAFLESSTINPAGLSLMGYYWYLELEENGLFKKKLWGKDNLSRLPGKHGMRGKFSGDCYRLGNTLGTPVIHGDRNPLSIHLRHPPKGFTGRANQQYSSVA